jgi:hypothetical protein
MAVSALGVAKLSANAKITSYLPGDASTAKFLTYVDMRDYLHFMAIADFTTLVGTGITLFELWVATDSVGTGATKVRAHALGSAPYAAGAQLALELITAELESVLAQGRWVAVKIQANNAGDVSNVTYIQHKPRFPASALTATA